MDKQKISEDDMILAFVQAEFDSPRFGSLYHKLLACYGATQDIIYNPDITNQKENDMRKSLISDIRGFGKDIFLFEQFPTDVVWEKVDFAKEDVKDLLFEKFMNWVIRSKETRLVGETAREIEAHPIKQDENVLAMIERIK